MLLHTQKRASLLPSPQFKRSVMNLNTVAILFWFHPAFFFLYSYRYIRKENILLACLHLPTSNFVLLFESNQEHCSGNFISHISLNWFFSNFMFPNTGCNVICPCKADNPHNVIQNIQVLGIKSWMRTLLFVPTEWESMLIKVWCCLLLIFCTGVSTGLLKPQI